MTKERLYWYAVLLLILFSLSTANVSEVSSAVTNLSVQAIEVTQAIQCLDKDQNIQGGTAGSVIKGYTQCEDNSLELTAERNVAVRVTHPQLLVHLRS